MTPFAPALAGLGTLLCGGRLPFGARVGLLVARGRLPGVAEPAPRRRAGRGFGAALDGRAGLLLPVAIGTAAFVAMMGGLLAVAVEIVAAVLGLLVRDARRRRRCERAGAAAVEAVRLVGAELSAGTTLARALEAAADAVPEHAAALRKAGAEAATAGDTAQPLLATGEPALVGAGHALRLADRCGAPVATVLARVEADVDARRRRSQELSAALAGPRASCATLAGLPVLGLGLGALMGAHPTGFLFGAVTGRAVCCAGVALDALGVLWVRRIVAQAVPP